MASYGFNSLSLAQYDDEDRLIAWNRDDGNQDQSWNLSLVGDWDSFTEQAVTETRTHSGVHDLESISGGSIPGGLSYDSKGNLTTHSNGHDYTWDFDNKLSLASVSSGEPGIAGMHSYTYDALGRRVSKTVGSNTTVLICSGQQVLLEYAGGTAAASPAQQYVYGSYIDEPVLMDAGGTQYYYHRNHLYSIAALTDSLGNVVERYAYDAYGTPTILDAAATTILLGSTVDNPYLYTGRRLDEETTLYYYRARHYDAQLGRFVSRDPIGYAGGIGLYLYTLNSPVNRVDPTGLIPPWVREGYMVDGPNDPKRGLLQMPPRKIWCDCKKRWPKQVNSTGSVPVSIGKPKEAFTPVYITHNEDPWAACARDFKARQSGSIFNRRGKFKRICSFDCKWYRDCETSETFYVTVDRAALVNSDNAKIRATGQAGFGGHMDIGGKNLGIIRQGLYGFTELTPPENRIKTIPKNAFVVKRNPVGYLDGKPCSLVCDSQIVTCIRTRASPKDLLGWSKGDPFIHCQTDVYDTLEDCCLQPGFTPLALPGRSVLLPLFYYPIWGK